MFRCNATAEDSIEHYCQCAITKKILRSRLNLDPNLYGNLHTLLLCNIHTTTNDQLTSTALLTYALYNTTNHYRHNPPNNSHQAYDAISQALIEGAKHHPGASSTLDNRWNPERTSKPIPPIPLHL